MVKIICVIVSIASLVYSIIAFKQKGPLLSTMYLLGNKKEREKMKTKEEYYFIGWTFLGVAILFCMISIGMIFHLPWTQRASIYFAVILVGYVAVTSIKHALKKK